MCFVADSPPPCSSDPQHCDTTNNNHINNLLNRNNQHLFNFFTNYKYNYYYCYFVRTNTSHIITVVNTLVVVNTHPINIAYANNNSPCDGHANEKP